MGFKSLGFKVLGFKSPGFKVFGFKSLGFEVLEFKSLGFKVLAFTSLQFSFLCCDLFEAEAHGALASYTKEERCAPALNPTWRVRAT